MSIDDKSQILSLENRYSTESNAVDDVYGEYPFLLHKNSYISRNNIL